MRKNRLIYTLLVVVCLIFSIVYKSRLSSVLLITVIAYPLIALALTAAQLLCIKAGFAETRGVYEKNRVFDIGVYISNQFVFAYAPVEVQCMLPDNETGLFATKRLFASLSPMGKTRISVACMHKYRGSFSAKIERIAVFDPLRIIRLSRKTACEMTLVFLPRKIKLGDLIPAASGERSLVQLNHLTGEKDDFSHVRGYLSGDMLQLIHWKLTAKTDEFMIKQYEEINEQKALILCDMNIDATGSSLLMKADSIIETAIAFALSASDSGLRATVDMGAADNSLVCDINGRSSFDRFYELMSVIPARIESADFPAMVTKNIRSNASVFFLITSRLSDELLKSASLLADGIPHLVVLAYVNPAAVQVSEQYENRRFLFLNLTGDSENALLDAAEKLSDSEQ